MPPKKKVASDEVSGSSSEEDSSDSSSVDQQLEIQVEFEARQTVEEDFHGIRRLLQQIFLKANVDLSGLTDLILAQKNIGSAIKVCEEDEASGEGAAAKEEEEEEEEDVYGVTTVINLTHHRSRDCVQQVSELLLSQCHSHDSSKHARLSQLLGDSSRHVGLLVNERFLNIPPEIAPPLLTSLMSEIKSACRKGQPFDFCYYVVVARCHVVSVKPQPGKKRKRKEKTSGATLEQETSKESPLFDHFEYEILQKESILTFSYPVAEESDLVLGGHWSFDDEAMKPFRTVMVIPARNLEHAVTEIERALRN